jgi:predicted AAA+ superfamily ATPase
MIPRRLHHQVEATLAETPAVALLGPRQVGKTTLALQIASSRPSIYLDLESERDRAKLDQAELYLADHLDRLVVLDEVHRAPGLFPILRGTTSSAPIWNGTSRSSAHASRRRPCDASGPCSPITRAGY